MKKVSVGASGSKSIKGTKSPAHNSGIKKKRSYSVRVKWTDPELRAVRGYFAVNLMEKEVPGKGECERFLAENQQLVGHRTWSTVKDCVRNLILRLSREATVKVNRK